MSFIDTQAQAWAEIRSRFSCNETPNGPGSFLANTEAVREFLPKLITGMGIESILDVPCGDWNWMKTIDLTGVKYTGWDIEFITQNRERFPQHTFEQVNILTATECPAVDLIVCRDFMIHLPNEQITHILDLFRGSGSLFLLATNHPAADNAVDLPPEGHDDRPGYWCRKVNLELFGLTDRVASVIERPGQELVLFEL